MTADLPVLFVFVEVRLSPFFGLLVFLSTDSGMSCECLSYVVSAVPQPPCTKGVLVDPFFQKLETFPLFLEMSHLAVEGIQGTSLRQLILNEEQICNTVFLKMESYRKRKVV